MSQELMSQEECKNTLIELLRNVADICDKHQLVYNLSYGSMLGAIRHKGFIPWDDDIDITLPRKDYEMLIKILKTQKECEWMTVLDSNINGYYYPFAKVVDSRTCAKMEDNITEHGIWIDVFPLDNLPNNEKKAKRYIFKCLIKRSVIISMTTDFKSKNLGKKRFLKHVLKIYAQIRGPENIRNSFIHYMKKYEDLECEYIACLFSPYGQNERVKKIDMLKRNKYIFEGLEFWGPADFDKYLSRLYGDYMTLPSKDKQNNHDIIAWRVRP